jgi:hypothetical protein
MPPPALAQIEDRGPRRRDAQLAAAPDAAPRQSTSPAQPPPTHPQILILPAHSGG